ncbi:SpoIIE family protein phosphatase [Mycobacterium sp.]|uniref:SpoIIE family protein phosphatase n=1 Tax=Mycobacterium sp. TaxID=1785 RepID=UPI0025EC00CD|nr:SpoIIE family protein phosphatase [Mycobacterium sp.]MBW0011630.1 SpoIIE family protein phosphatase [Mycobacterium sp.]
MTAASHRDVAAEAAISPFVGDSEMAARMRAFDWSKSLIGPVADWPQSLRTAVGICLSSRYPMVIWWGAELVLLYNDAWVPILGPEKHPALGRAGAEVWPEMWHIIGKQLNSVLQTGAATFSDDQLLPANRFGYLEEAYFTYSYSAIRDEAGAVGGVFTAVTETTQRVLSERRLRALRALGERTANAATQNGATMETVCDAALQSLAHNRTDLPFAAVFAVDPAQDGAKLICSMGLSDPSVLRPPQDELLKAVRTNNPVPLLDVPRPWAQAALGGANPVGDQPPEKAAAMPIQLGDDGSAAAVLLGGVTPYRSLDDEFLGFLGLVAAQISRAVSDALAYQAQRRRAEALAALDKAKSEFFANVSHEFRTPLTLIAGPAQDSLLDAQEPLGPAQRERVEVIRRNAGRLRRLVDDLLDFATIEAGKRLPERQFVDLAVATRELVASFAPAFSHAGLELRCEIQELRRPVSVDVGMWEKIVLNLLSNAVKYTLAGNVEVRLEQDGDAVRLTVADTGIGIPSDELPKVFERFHRVRGREGRSHEGAGIGLALVAELVHLHDGEIAVQSWEGEGSTFTIELPCPAPSATATAETVPSRPDVSRAYLDEALQWSATRHHLRAAPASSPDAACVLVVEDNADMRAFISDVLAPYWRVVEAADGLAGLALAREHLPELVLTDVMMPQMDGFQLLSALRSDPRTAATPVLFLSARAGEEAAVGGLDAGADDYLAKPFSTVELLARVRSNLEMARYRNREAQFRKALIDSMQEGCFVTDEDGTVVEANRAFFQMTGWDAAGLPYRWPQPWIPAKESEPDAWAICENAYARSLSDDGGRFTLPLRHRDGHRLWVACSAGIVTDPHNDRQLFVGTAVDVTAERLASQRDEYLSQFAVALAGNRTTNGLLGVATKYLAKVFGARRVVVAQWDDPAAKPDMLAWPPDHIDQQGQSDQESVVEALQTARNCPAASVMTFVGDDGTATLAAPLDGAATSAIAIQRTSSRPAPREDRELFGQLTSHLAQALLAAREYERTRTVALTLQHAILGPTRLPHGFAVRYKPAEEPLQVGGDWYDVFRLRDQRVGVVVGDCVGRGLSAAAVMGQLRSAVRALLLATSSPVAVLDCLDQFAWAIPDAKFATVICAVIDPATSVITYASAGHPPPVVVSADGETQLLDRGQSLPVAATSSNVPRIQANATVPPCATLLLYTDGLIERRGESIDWGVQRARLTLSDHRHLHPEVLGDRLMHDLAPPGGYDDDVAVLLYRQPPRPLRLQLPAIADNLRIIREHLRQWLPAAAIDAATLNDLLLAVGEAAANSVEHAGHETIDHDTIDGVQLTVTAEITDASLVATVSDNGRWRPPPEAPGNRGHGFLLMKALVDRFNVTCSAAGTTVVLEKDLCP